MDYVALAREYGWAGAVVAGILFVVASLIRRGIHIRIDAEIPPRNARTRTSRGE